MLRFAKTKRADMRIICHVEARREAVALTPHVEVRHSDDVVQVTVVLEPEALLVPGDRALAIRECLLAQHGAGRLMARRRDRENKGRIWIDKQRSHVYAITHFPRSAARP